MQSTVAIQNWTLGLQFYHAGTLWLNRTLANANFTLNKFQNVHAHM